MNINKNDIKNAVDSVDFNRGNNYYNLGKVFKCEVKEKNLLSIILSGTVRGSSGKVYYQDIELDFSNSRLSIDGDCSCPVGYNCKHIVAVCLEYVSNHQVVQNKNVSLKFPSKPAMDVWLNNLQDLANTNNEKNNKQLSKIKQSGDYFLTYRLFSTDRTSYHLMFYKSKILKNGNISKGTLLDGYKVMHDYYYQDIKQEEDKNILQLASGLDEGEYRYKRGIETIEGSLGYMLILAMLETNRCYFNEHLEPLRLSQNILSPEFKLSLYKGEYKLKSNYDNKSYKILDTKPPLILDIEANSICEFGMEVSLYHQLLAAPKIAKDDIGRVYSSIGQAVPNINLTTPNSIKTKVIETKPIPQIHLRYTKNENAKNYTSFKIDFNYDGYINKFHPQEESRSFYDENLKIDIKRDLEFEQNIDNQIKSLGFGVEYLNQDLFVVLKDENKQQQLKLWKKLLEVDIPKFQEDGWIVKYDEHFDMKFEANSDIVVQSEDQNGWFSLSFNIEFGGVSQPIAPLVTSIIDEFNDYENMPETINLEIDENHFVELQTKQIQPILKTIIELMDKKEDDDTLKVSPFDAHLIDNMDDDIIWKGNKEILELSQKLKDFSGIKKVKQSSCLTATLRDYQQEGLNWLNFLYEFKFAGILADDMGLGKTIQTLAHLSRLKEDKKLTKPSLIVMPTSLIANWKNEIAKFTPNLSVLSLHGDERFDKFKDIKKYDILLTTYNLTVRDKEIFDKEKFFYIILDEAQKIKNPKTKMAVAIKSFKSEHRLALSGTPIENHLGELWSIFSFLMPGFLDTLTFFKNYYQTPIEKENNINRQELLNKRVKPFMIRRTKEKVALELPAKTEIVKYTQFSTKQTALYESIRVTMDKKVREAVSKKGIGSSHIMILDALLKLRQVCCDPSLLKIEEAKKVQESAKLELFLDLVDELILEDRKILVFSQFTSMLTILEDNIKKRKYKYTKLTGSTRKREEAIDKFTKGDAQIFLISLKAGGVGLNLVEADTVIHYDPWWNPAVENQATDRAYRIGQNKAVFVYKLIVENTIEQKILELQKKKQAIQDGIYEKDGQKDDFKFSGDELMELLK
ncbi:MAG: DEAD/DEAH box helicase [Campylobacterota bacterium]|nr:DEAD/DEAH box helicase [Campylobacterota bacterium]